MKKVLSLLAAVLWLAACGGDKAMFKQAQLATSKGDFTKAIQIYSRIIKQDPNHYAAIVNRGVLWERLPVKDAKERAKNRRFAEADYLHAIDVNPDAAEPFNNVGALYVDMGRNTDAAFYLSEALVRNPKYFTALMNRAIARYRQGRTVEALQDFNSALKLRDDEPLLFLNRGLAYFDSGMFDAALDDFSYLIHLRPDDARAYLERARVFMAMGYPSNAYADLEEAVSIQPSYALAYYYMGDLLFRKGEKEQALGMLVRSKELANQYVPTYELMGDMLAMEDPVSATANYMVAKKLDPKNARRYDAKIRMMQTEKGRERVLANRFFPR
ncbi:MAG: tetratricopeptide repeat protein [Candidatus Avelusimicrobium sp.]|uniref:tetratricopeptide repeat protein n=1 Tax=Candidatus Avelusimicrobium sp. TaxID=3048833 RepID=UPI003F0C3223